MKRIQITDETAERAFSKAYDWFVVGVGNETRIDCVLNKLISDRVSIGKILALYYPTIQDERKTLVSKLLSQIVPTKCRLIETTIESDNTQMIYSLLQDHFSIDSNVSLLIDYSSMSRVWYAALLLWFREQKQLRACFTFLYSKGKYTMETAKKEVVISDIKIVPGCEGESYRRGKTALILGLGFYGYMSLCVCEQMEPDIIYTILTPENPVEGFDIANQDGNKELINRAAASFQVPLLSVESAYRCMMDVATLHLVDNDEVTIVPMGPKPHVLAAVLAALADRRICTLRVRHDHYDDDIQASGIIVSTIVEFVEIVMPKKDEETHDGSQA